MNKLLVLGSLYIAQFLPLAFFGQALPIYMRQQGSSLEVIGLISLLGLPWSLRVFWSPFVDRYGWHRWGHYKSWIVVMQSLLVLTIGYCAFLKIQTDFSVIIISITLVITFVATQDIATDALTVESLDISQRAWGNTLKVAGGYLGAIIGGGLILFLLDYWGWTSSLLLIALGVGILTIPILCYSEKCTNYSAKPAISWAKLLEFLQLPRILFWLVILLIYMMGFNITNLMSRPLFVDLGLSLTEIGIMSGVIAYSSGLFGSFLGGFLVKFLGRKSSLAVCGFLMTVAIAAFILPVIGFDNLLVLYVITISLHLVYSMACIAQSTMMMDRCRKGNAGFDYTFQATIITVGNLIVSSLSGLMTELIGYVGTFTFSSVLCLLSSILIFWIFKDSDWEMIS